VRENRMENLRFGEKEVRIDYMFHATF
jgi:hypothetical protein